MNDGAARIQIRLISKLSGQMYKRDSPEYRHNLALANYQVEKIFAIWN